MFTLPRSFLVLALASPTLAADFPKPYNSEKDSNADPMAAAEVAAQLELPPGFRATVFAAEPDVQNPVAMAWDGRGRLWVAENYTYAERAVRFDLGLRDRVVIFEDRDGDGKFDERKVFTDDVQILTSVEVGHGGVWLMCPPRLLFIPDKDRDDKPDGPAEVMLDGFTVGRENYHNFANGLRWGPDGWLYGRCGASAPGKIGGPGTPEAERHDLIGGIWRYHPVTQAFETLTYGTTNPWGHDWDQHGEGFFVNSVNGHLWHLIPGARFVRPHTIDPNPRSYAQIDMHADHWHFDTKGGWTASRDGKANSLGGGHAHVGAMIYQGDNWPAEYRGRLFTLNLHGRRANQDILERHGSGYVAKHGKDMLLFPDPFFRGTDLSYGPNGDVFVLDWSDTGECHENSGVHRTSGRIYRVSYGEPKRPAIGDIETGDEDALFELIASGNEWIARQARLALAHRFGPKAGRMEKLRRRTPPADSPEARTQLRTMWALHSMGGADLQYLVAQLGHANEHVRAWAIRLLTDHWPLDGAFGPVPVDAARRTRVENDAPGLLPEFIKLAKNDESGLVRLTLASTLQRLPVPLRSSLAAALVARAEDAGDHNLPLLVWYGLIPVADTDPRALVEVASASKWPLTTQYITRRLSEELGKNGAPLNDLLTRAGADSNILRASVVEGMAEALTGWRKAPKPAAWDRLATQISGDTKLQDRTRELSVVFGDGRALDEIKALALDGKANLNSRMTALQTLIDSRPDDLRKICEKLISERHINPVAARGLALFDDPEAAALLVKSFRHFHPSNRPQLLSILVSRPSYAMALLKEIKAGQIGREHLSAFHARQIRSLDDPAVTSLLAEVWGEFRDTPEAKQKTIASLKEKLTPKVLAQADKSHGRVLFTTLCGACHRMYGEGGTMGPDLTGSGRDNLDYLLGNIVDPGAVVDADFRMTVVKMKDGRVLNGVISARTDRTLTLRSATEELTVEHGEVDSTETLNVSQMPEGLLETLTPEQVRDLIAYLQHPSQVPLATQR